MEQSRSWQPVMVMLVICTVPTAGLRTLQASDFPYWGVVARDSVDVHSGAGDSYYVAGHLPKGALVRVHNHFHHWFKIAPPKGVYSYVKKAFINRQGDGAVGTAMRDGVMVRTAANGDGPPGASYRQQRFLRTDENVRIAAEAGDFYKIVPPKNTFVFLPPNSVSPATAEQMEAGGLSAPRSVPAESPTKQEPPLPVVTPALLPAPPPPAVARPAFAQPAVKVEEEAPPSVHPAPSVADIATVALPKLVDADKVPAGSRPDRVPAVAEDSTERTIMSGSPTVMAAEMRLSAVSKSPLDRQPITELLETYETLHQDSSLGDRDRQLVRARLMQLRRREQLAATLRGVSEFREGLKVRSVDSSEVFAQRQAPDYAAVGRLLSSIVYNGQDLPLLFRVVEPASGRTLAYVRPGTKTQATNYLGKLVGVVGAARFNAALKANIVEADRVDLLEPVDELTANHGAPFSVAAPPYAVDWGTAGVLRPEAGSL